MMLTILLKVILTLLILWLTFLQCHHQRLLDVRLRKEKRVVCNPASKRTRAKLNQPVSKGSKQTVPADIQHVYEGYTDKDECAKFSPRRNVGSHVDAW